MSEEKKFRYVWVAVAIALVIGIGAAARENYFPSIRADRIVSTKDVTTTDNVTTANITQANIVTDNVTTLHAGSMTVTDMIATRQSLLKNACVVSTATSITSHSDATQTGSMAWCVTQLGSTGTIFLPEKAAVYTINSNYSIPEGIVLLPSAGAILSPENSITLSIYGDYRNQGSKGFAGLGTISFPQGTRTDGCVANWWVDDGNGSITDPWTSTLDTVAGIQKALAACGDVRLLNGYYSVTTQINMLDNSRITGVGKDRTFLTSATTGDIVMMGDETKAVKYDNMVLRDLSILASGAGAVAIHTHMNKSLVRNVRIDLDSSDDNQTGIWMDATKGTSLGNFHNTFSDIAIFAGATATTASSGLNMTGSYNNGQNNYNSFYNFSVYGGKYGITVGPSLGNYWHSVIVEDTKVGDTDAHAWRWDNYAWDNAVFGYYTETNSGYTGTVVECSAKLDDSEACVIQDDNCSSFTNVSRAYRNVIHNWMDGANVSNSDISCYGGNIVTKGNMIYGSAPDEDGDPTNYNAMVVRVAGETYPRLRVGTGGIQAGEGTAADTEYVVFSGGPTNRPNSMTTTANPDISQGLNIYIEDFDDNDTNITSFDNATGAPYVLLHPSPQANNLKITFTDTATEIFKLYEDTLATDDNVTISGVGTGVTEVHFRKANHRYALLFGCYLSVADVRQWMLLNRVSSTGEAGDFTSSALTVGTVNTIPISDGSAFTSDDNLTFDTATDILSVNNVHTDKIQAGSNATTGLRITKSAGTTTMLDFDTVNNRIGFWNDAPSYDFSFAGDADRTIGLERRTTSTYEGSYLLLRAGSAASGQTDKNGGPLILRSGVSTGSGTGDIRLQTAWAAASGTADNVNTNNMFQITGNKIGFYGATPVTKATEMTDELTTVSVTAPAAADYAMDNGTFGFSTLNEFRSAVSVIANLQARVKELEDKLVAYGLLTDAD